MLGGVTVPFSKGLLGHSDGDALLHAVIDALLGAAGLGDIGGQFPSSNPAFKDADSKELLRQVGALIHEHGWRLGNLDATIIVEQPVMKPYLEPCDSASLHASLLNRSKSISKPRPTMVWVSLARVRASLLRP
jgi:2-C-methyl-D-erythritol 2,4-cyclodiphosphate synthase